MLAVASANPFAPRCGCRSQAFLPSMPKPSCGCQTPIMPRTSCQAPIIAPSYQTQVVSQPCHQRIQVPITSYINEEIDMPIEVVENIPVAEENADYQKDEREFRADANAFEEGHSRYQRWEDADACNRNVQERGCSQSRATMIPMKRCDHQKVDIQVPVEEIVEIDVEVPQPIVQRCGCNRCAQNLPCLQQQSYLLPQQSYVLPQQSYVLPQPAMIPQSTILPSCGSKRPCGCSKPQGFCGCNQYFF